jgi:tRNA (adenine-N(1)-)-methyltransferase non-catalytic subunit
MQTMPLQLSTLTDYRPSTSSMSADAPLSLSVKVAEQVAPVDATTEAAPESGSSTTPVTKVFTAHPPREPKRPLDAHDPSLEPMSEVMLRRVNKIQNGDNVLLKLPSDSIKAVVASADGSVGHIRCRVD